MDLESSDLTESSIRDVGISDDDDSDSEDPMKMRPGESAQEFDARIERLKNASRIQKLMKFAFPRQRETHIYKKQLLSPKEMNLTVSLV